MNDRRECVSPCIAPEHDTEDRGRIGIAPRAVRRAMCAWLLGCGSAVAEPEAFDNAAMDYWKAGALLQPILSREDLDAAIFIERQLPLLPPRAFSFRPEAGRWLLKERPMLLALHAGVEKPFCRFHAPEEADPDLSYRVVMSDVIGRSLAAASAFEFVDSAGTSARIHVDVLRLIDHLDDDVTWASAYDAANRLPAVHQAIAGYLSREPPRQAVEPLSAYLAGLDRPVFAIDELLRAEMRAYVRGFLTEIEHVERNLLSLYREGEPTPAANQLLPLDLEGKKRLLVNWLDDYQNEVSRLATALSRPYPEAIRIVTEMDERVEDMRKNPSREGQNPMLPLLMPPLSRTYEQFVATEATYTMLDILAAAAIYKDFVREWPKDLKTLESFTGRTFARDPFTMEPVQYDRKGGLARVRIRAPKWIGEETRISVEFDLDARVERDAKNFEALAKSIEEEQRAERRETISEAVRLRNQEDTPRTDSSGGTSSRTSGSGRRR